MTFVVTENCIQCKYTDCVEVCPVDCFYEGPNFLVIHPDECIDCALCEPECPAEAIFSEDELPDGQEQFIEINAELAEVWPNIAEKKDPLPDAEEWDGFSCEIWSGCLEGNEFVSCIGNFEHGWPYVHTYPETSINVTRIIWDFMKRHSRN